MIELLHDPADPASRRVADALTALTVAHTVTTDATTWAEGIAAPVIREGDRVVSGTEDLARYLHRLEAYMGEWSRFQGDSCYIGDDGCVV